MSRRVAYSWAFTDLHPLSIEDMLGSDTIARSKVEYYPDPQHIFLRILCHVTQTPKADTAVPADEAADREPSEETTTTTLLALNPSSVNVHKPTETHRTIRSLASVGLSAAQIHVPGDVAWAREVFPEIRPIDILRPTEELKGWFSMMRPVS